MTKLIPSIDRKEVNDLIDKQNELLKSIALSLEAILSLMPDRKKE